jgi:hypothetical protein
VPQASRFDIQPLNAAAAVSALAAEAAAFQGLNKSLAGAGALTGCLGPVFPRGEQGSGQLPAVYALFAAFLYPCADSVFAFEIVLGCAAHGGGCRQAVVYPSKATGNYPIENARPLCFQLFWQLRIAFCGGNGDGERYEVKPPPNCFVD